MGTLISQETEIPPGYTTITDMKQCHPEMMLDFGILKLSRGEKQSNSDDRERAFLLIQGDLEAEWGGRTTRMHRESVFDQTPYCLHVPARTEVTFTALNDQVEIAVQGTTNAGSFPARLLTPSECRSEDRGRGTMGETSTRIVRTIFDDSTAPFSNLVLGEVITFPGKWSSYPPHHHPQPEIYHYRFLPPGGFGLTLIGTQAFLVQHNDTVLIQPGEVHPQVAAPGYAMYYIWVIRHLENERYGTPVFVPQHRWVADRHANIWTGTGEEHR